MILNDVASSRCERHIGTVATAALPSSRHVDLAKPATPWNWHMAHSA